MNMCKFLKGAFDWIVIFAGCIFMIGSLAGIDDNCLKCCIYIAAILAVGYGGYAFFFFFCKRPQFDWHLINGHFLRKTCCLILLMPFLLTALSDLFFVDSPKELVYEINMYECMDNGLTSEIKHKQENPNLFWSTYYHFVDPGNQHMTTTKHGRAWAAIIAILGVFLLNGLLVSSIIGWIDRRKEKWLKGEVKYKWFLKLKSHYVIIGGNDMVIGIVKHIFEKFELKHPTYILIQTSRDVESFRRELFSTLTEMQRQHIIIYYGNRTSSEDIQHLILNNVQEVYILGEDTRTDDIESYHDTMNMECLDLLAECYKTTDNGLKIREFIPAVADYRSELKAAGNNKGIKKQIEAQHKDLIKRWGDLRGLRLKCRVMFEYQTTSSVFQFYDIDESMDAYIDFRPFNYYEMWAQKVLINKEIDEQQLLAGFKNNGYLPLEGATGIDKTSDDYVHLFVVGMSRMGVAMAIEAAHLAHYPNYEEKKIRTKITFVDKNAAEEKDFFMGRFKELFSISHWRYGEVSGDRGVIWNTPHIPCGYEYLGGDFLDIEWEFINGGIEQTAVQDYILETTKNKVRITIAVCLPESNRSHASALYLHKKIYESDSVQQVLVYNRYGDSIINSINKSDSIYPYRGKLRSFGCACNCFEDDILERSERIGAEIGKFYNGDSPLSTPVYDNAGKSKSACVWSNIYNGNTLWTKLRSVDYAPDIFEKDDSLLRVLAKVEHNRWNIEQLLMNFRYVTPEEQEFAMTNDNANKNELKRKMAHLNICSNDRLVQIDAGAMKYDMDLTKCLSGIYQNETNNTETDNLIRP